MIITVTHTKARTTTASFNKAWAAAAISGHAWECYLAMLFCSSLTCPFLFLNLFLNLIACCNISRVAAWWEQGFDQPHPLTGTPRGHRLSRCPGKLRMPDPWKCSRPGWKGPWATWPDRRWQRSSTRWCLITSHSSQAVILSEFALLEQWCDQLVLLH